MGTKDQRSNKDSSEWDDYLLSTVAGHQDCTHISHQCRVPLPLADVDSNFLL